MNNYQKYYTSGSVSRRFVETVRGIVDFDTFDLILEPSAGDGSILQYLPAGSVGIDIDPGAQGIYKMDFFQYAPPCGAKRILCIGNPPFGFGYMNPLAKQFFNHAASFSRVVAFIVPAKWHTSWKIHKQLNPTFGLYYSEILPKNSFLLNGKPYDVRCCMQVWSIDVLGINLRLSHKPPTTHKDFDLFLTCDKVPKLNLVRQQLRNREYWDFGIKYWGKIEVCNLEDIPYETTTHFLISSKKSYVRHVFESVSWDSFIYNMGAPNVGGKSVLIKIYDETKQKLGICDEEPNLSEFYA